MKPVHKWTELFLPPGIWSTESGAWRKGTAAGVPSSSLGLSWEVLGSSCSHPNSLEAVAAKKGDLLSTQRTKLMVNSLNVAVKNNACLSNRHRP